MPKHIAVALGHFDALVRHGLTQILREDRDLRIIGTDLNNAALGPAVARWGPRVAILDEASVVELSVLEGLRVVEPAIGIVVLAHRPAHEHGMRLLAAGASCISKDVSAADILAAVHSAAEDRRVFVPSDGRLVERRYPANASLLTPRETEVLEHLSRGRSNPEIARALQISVDTAHTHVANIRRKLKVQSKRELIGMPIPNHRKPIGH
jgi:DNA-binding NarL/FixJ family response regulator